ncbi:MAG TPA: phospho-N-acetylmuramoyl-pentapeptide-transferase [Thermoanaerobaculia bacterium]|jgi:phospho-N-acetylmuramoyl-pentapeptide-transferase|nr:phospho-N-acetylmuramoyl-pentapeptide-transferase [Thermoanaerobaculia bacterium]
MLYYLLYPLRNVIVGFNVFRYITFRTAFAALTALLISFIFGPWLIERMRRVKLGQYIREEGPKSHQQKAGTPTMGGILINVAILIPTILWADISNPYIWIILFVTFAYGAIGFVDDYRKLVKKRNLGLTAKEKFIAQFGVALLAGLAIGYLPMLRNNYSTALTFPFIKQFVLNLGPLYIPFVMVIIVGASNAVNLTDGLDGLAIGSTMIAAATYTILTYAAGHARIADYLKIAWVPQTGELAVFCGAMVGASLGFLWFNAYPAEIFMGDVGSLALGGAIGTLAVMIKQEILLIFVGGLFVIEALSVILQVFSFKMTGRRIFKMSPIHHHFELSGWRETKVVVRFWIIAIIFALLSLATLKLR